MLYISNILLNLKDFKMKNISKLMFLMIFIGQYSFGFNWQDFVDYTDEMVHHGSIHFSQLFKIFKKDKKNDEVEYNKEIEARPNEEIKQSKKKSKIEEREVDDSIIKKEISTTGFWSKHGYRMMCLAGILVGLVGLGIVADVIKPSHFGFGNKK